MTGGEYGANGDYGAAEFGGGGFEQQANGDVQANGFDNGVGFQQDHMVGCAVVVSIHRVRRNYHKERHPVILFCLPLFVIYDELNVAKYIRLCLSFRRHGREL